MAMSILLKILTLKWNISRTIWCIEVSDGLFFRIFYALSFEPNFVFDQMFPLNILHNDCDKVVFPTLSISFMILSWPGALPLFRLVIANITSLTVIILFKYVWSSSVIGVSIL